MCKRKMLMKLKCNTESIFLISGLICKVSAGNENAFQTTTYLSVLSNREPLLLPLVLGLRHWARVCFLAETLTCVIHQPILHFNIVLCLWFRFVWLTVQKKAGFQRTSLPSWLSTFYSSVKNPSYLLTWDKRCVSCYLGSDLKCTKSISVLLFLFVCFMLSLETVIIIDLSLD